MRYRVNPCFPFRVVRELSSRDQKLYVAFHACLWTGLVGCIITIGVYSVSRTDVTILMAAVPCLILTLVAQFGFRWLAHKNIDKFAPRVRSHAVHAPMPTVASTVPPPPAPPSYSDVIKEQRRQQRSSSSGGVGEEAIEMHELNAHALPESAMQQQQQQQQQQEELPSEAPPAYSAAIS